MCFDLGTLASKEDIEAAIDVYNTIFESPIRLNFANTEITQNDCYDNFSNLILDLCNSQGNEVVIHNSYLRSYIEENYTNYKIVSSFCNIYNDITEDLNNYDIIVLNDIFNKDNSTLTSIPVEQRNKVELLINNLCPSSCAYKMAHYLQNNNSQLSYGETKGAEINCPLFKNINKYSDTVITRAALDDYEALGYNNFNLESMYIYPNIQFLSTLVQYFILPQYQQEILNWLEVLTQKDTNYGMYMFDITKFALKDFKGIYEK